MRRHRSLTALLIVSVLLLPACADASKEEESSGDGPARLEAVDGTDLSKVILTAEAVERLELKTETVQGGTHGQLLIPEAAVFYGTDGEAWTYTSPEDLTYLRESIEIDHIDGDAAYLSAGPGVGTAVVTVGAPELFGVETGIDD